MTMAIKWGTNNSEKIQGTNDDDLILAHGGDDEVNGYGGCDQLFGMSGDDDLSGGAGADYLDGGAGHDMATYRHSPAGVFVYLNSGQGFGFGGDAEGDTLVSIERVTGSEYDDLLSAHYSVAGHFLNGGGGNDTLVGGEGDDTLVGGEGRDFLMGGGGGDFLYAGPGSLNGGDGELYAGPGSNSLNGGDGEDYLFSGMVSDRLTGGNDCDTFVFEAAEVRIHEYAVESTSTSPASDPDNITDFEARDDLIDMNIAGTATNYIETALGYNAGYLAAKSWAETAMPGGNGLLRFGFVTDGVNGYLFGDLDGDQYIETGVVLEGLTSLNDFHHSHIL
jgi:Ca2+-binding RTX toxin-like protein